MWDERYNSKQYVYGTRPNDFLKERVQSLPKGRILSLAEGEGRNAVFLARLGYKVTAVDSSAVGLEKAHKLASLHGVSIECIHADLAEFEFGENQWHGIISILCPLPSSIRKLVYQKVEKGLLNGGVFLTESYTPKQLRYGTGGGDCIDTMQTKATLTRELPNLEFNHLFELEREIIEGDFHTGLGAVVQAIATKYG
ncbi:class I SAM-dependent methyltransferase [Pseudoalteromonas sp. S16_S37]|uniref:class I SAM-dependent methyltransferase n=1 Tax=Pseudoalteromonas sp. S16_S37 TaxID=2720228 RepID=UPI0016814826|nr:class I SAM-dependent methyltransferase [Pseudoalteromonas sp. S16_S37]MBD1581361.1 class I SAM-dependent methyltransferase [Pseudoalteromonas sp. S16_S37]